ncbi:hypothetical protein OPV22_019541 [Ensete ventricosum]|uniref:Uncharacterized protein n=1 Tax=Ensete ventricosum TaxID=4639 RepID=A0AAV8QH68_ENSVE|nr:hypothetical protein OPV22_019541 [Ensete ventricosum]
MGAAMAVCTSVLFLVVTWLARPRDGASSLPGNPSSCKCWFSVHPHKLLMKAAEAPELHNQWIETYELISQGEIPNGSQDKDDAAYARKTNHLMLQFHQSFQPWQSQTP